MSNIVRTDPFDVAFRDFFRNMLRPTRLDLETTEPEIRLDLKETEKAYMVHAEIPGVRKEDIDVSIDGSLVSIRAEVRREKEEKGETMLRSERYYGAMTRSFTLATEVDEKAATAKYSDGVLELMLPKKPGGTTRRLQVQ
jgi:HSP20 family protein